MVKKSAIYNFRHLPVFLSALFVLLAYFPPVPLKNIIIFQIFFDRYFSNIF